MKMSAAKFFTSVSALLLVVQANACRPKDKSQGSRGSLLSLKTQPKSAIPDGAVPAKLCDYIKSNGFFPSNKIVPDTKILFSSSYEVVENSAGQGYGIVGSDGFFVQQGNNTQQLLLCPGAANISGGRCQWKISGDDGYAQLALDVVCNKRSRTGAAIHPGYTKQSANLVSYQASTAGQTVSGQEAVEVVLEGRSSTARIVFAKNQGLVATVFQESSEPAGTAEVFIGSSKNDDSPESFLGRLR
jgi:hypothetical protein